MMTTTSRHGEILLPRGECRHAAMIRRKRRVPLPLYSAIGRTHSDLGVQGGRSKDEDKYRIDSIVDWIEGRTGVSL
jgi:hypothetical protein